MLIPKMRVKSAYQPLVLLVLVLAGFGALVALSMATRPHELIPWRTDFAAAKQESARTGKPIFMDFTADWCGPCQELKRTTWSNASVAKSLVDYVPVQIDVDQHPDIAAQYPGQEGAIPHLVVADSSGKVIKEFEGALPPESFVAWLKSEEPIDPTLLMR